MEPVWDVAPPVTWATLTAAAALLLAGFVLLSHTLVRSKAHGDAFRGLTHSGRLERTIRLGAGCLLAGFGIWAYELAAPTWVVGGLGLLAAVSFALQISAGEHRR